MCILIIRKNIHSSPAKKDESTCYRSKSKKSFTAQFRFRFRFFRFRFFRFRFRFRFRKFAAVDLIFATAN